MSQELRAAIEKVERSHFRTHQDTGANANAMIVWNALRREAGLPALTQRDLMMRALGDYQNNAGRALANRDAERAEQYAAAARIVQGEIDAWDEAHPKVVVRETRCFS